MKKIIFLTTIEHNIGDDFIRDGIIVLLKEILGDFDAHFYPPLRTGSMMFF